MANSANTPAVQTTVKDATKRRQSRKATEPKAEAQPVQADVFENATEQAQEQVQEQKEYRKVIAVKQSFGRFYVYFKHVAPKDNVGCGCKTAQSAMRYCRLLKARHNAYLPDEVYQLLMAESAKEA